MSFSDDEFAEEMLFELDLINEEDEISDICLDTLFWSKNEIPVKVKEFTLKEGPTFDKMNTNNCMDYFNKMLPQTIFEVIVNETNIYARQKIKNSNDINKIWKDVTLQELYAYIGCRILMGISKLPSLDDYWSTDEAIGSVLLIRKTFSRNRFEEIDRNLHCVNNDSYVKIDKNDEKFDCLYKIRPVYEVLVESCRTKYIPSKYLSIDEGMTAFKGRIEMKQYIDSKPTKWGFKSWKLCNSQNGYICNFDYFKGRYDKCRKGSDVVLNLVQYLPKNYPWSIYCDTYFSSIFLAIELWKLNIYLTGTLRKNSKGLSIEFKNDTQNLEKNNMCWLMSKPQFSIISVYDSKPVTFITTCHSPTETYFKTNKSGIISCFMPKVMKDYNKYARGVDLNDQLIVYYSCNRKTRRWWVCLFWNMIDIAIINSLILKNMHEDIDNTYNQYYYRIKLAKELIGSFSNRMKKKKILIKLS